MIYYYKIISNINILESRINLPMYGEVLSSYSEVCGVILLHYKIYIYTFSLYIYKIIRFNKWWSGTRHMQVSL